MLFLGHDASFKTNIKQREARVWLRRLEQAIFMRVEAKEKEGYARDAFVDLDSVNRDLVECHPQVLWNRPIAFLRLIDSFKETLDLVSGALTLDRNTLDM